MKKVNWQTFKVTILSNNQILQQQWNSTDFNAILNIQKRIFFFFLKSYFNSRKIEAVQNTLICDVKELDKNWINTHRHTHTRVYSGYSDDGVYVKVALSPSLIWLFHLLHQMELFQNFFSEKPDGFYNLHTSLPMHFFSLYIFKFASLTVTILKGLV